VAAGGTRVWAQLARAPESAEASAFRAAGDRFEMKSNQRARGRAQTAARERRPVTEVHVIPDDRTTWRVYDAGADEAVSEHTSATGAEVAAKARAEDQDAQRVVVHDRYHRTLDAATSPAGAAARERLERTRRLARVRERARELASATR
jgi:hypothetical protein